MREYRFFVRIQSALFSHGASFRDLEIRSSAIRGAMHYWFRALLGDAISREHLKDLERKIFGSSRDTQAKLRLRVISEPELLKTASDLLLPHKALDLRGNRVKAFSPGSCFELKLDLSRLEEPYARLALWSLWLATNLGALGARCRRGAGSLLLEQVEPLPEKFPISASFSDPSALARHLETGLRLAKQELEGLRSSGEGDSGFNPLFPQLGLSSSELRVRVADLGPLDGDRAARKLIMERFRPFKNPVFGLPLMAGGQAIWKTEKGKTKKRFASPLWIRLQQLENGWAAVLSELRPLPNVEGVEVGKIGEYISSLSERTLDIDVR